ncbi:caspase, EACC1-associated type [Streptomyces liliifuscus]|uniref:Caspase family protein n=1 Tax=Streptomyces liliifuscus TaxID=2797636 RepID=A0A7T7L4T2_9ACTN|nr:caspase family protein [Streptomyces liliifuscus]QQM46361.1 caspase family protein [Streptomyces liliifuscus]
MADRERQALIVVTSAYDDPGLGALRAPTDDAEALAEVLGDPDVGGFEVEVLTDPDSQRLRVKVEDFFADRSPRHTLLLHFSCHGVKNTAGKLFLATADTRRSRLTSTAVPAEYVSGMMLASRAQRAVVLLDCCYAGAFERGMFPRADTDAHVQESFQDLERTGGRRGRAVFTASSAVQYAFEEDRPVTGADLPAGRRPSLFTGSLVKGLRSGDADRDGDGEIGMSELADYVSDHLAELTPHQTPQLWLFGAHGGDVPIARAKPRAPAAVALPAWLDGAVHATGREERLWAVEDLSTLLRGNDVGLALTARAALADLTHDDSRRVSQGAERALRTAHPRVATDFVDLGTVTAGTPGPPTLLALEGPPIVHATVEAALGVPWLRVTCVAKGVQVSADVAEPGHYEGDVLVRTATGELPVHVGVDAVPARRPRRPLARPARATPVQEPSVRKTPERAPQPPPAPGPVTEEPRPPGPKTSERKPPERREPESAAAVEAPPGRARAARLSAALLYSAFVLALLALVTPIATATADGRAYFAHTDVSGRGWLFVIALWAGLSTAGVLGALALRGSMLPFRTPVIGWLACVTAATIAVAGQAYSVLSEFSAYWAPSVGTVALTLTWIIELWCCVNLWRRRQPASPAPPRRG